MHVFLGILLPTFSLANCATIYPPPVDNLGRSPRGGLCAQIHPGNVTSFGLEKRSLIRFFCRYIVFYTVTVSPLGICVTKAGRQMAAKGTFI